MLQGLRTVIYPVSDAAKAKKFYNALTGAEPYFDQPFYIGYNVGGYELGLDPNPKKQASGPMEGPLTYWGVANIEEAYANILAIGARPHLPIQDVGEGIKVASVLDPFGNAVGLIENPGFKAQ
ncbi:MAG: VOC family protein [Bacteroidota bacterium]|nr:VOC family protein [Bacteroidota bacterium]MDP4231911.1 VOC family protein [Bacteroidota bacterium]MDP4241382.1 VOC family protein [Bacteroidota bacterium]MDP4287305.1 VOC family protein [Bacteroidota bacterium]